MSHCEEHNQIRETAAHASLTQQQGSPLFNQVRSPVHKAGNNVCHSSPPEQAIKVPGSQKVSHDNLLSAACIFKQSLKLICTSDADAQDCPNAGSSNYGEPCVGCPLLRESVSGGELIDPYQEIAGPCLAISCQSSRLTVSREVRQTRDCLTNSMPTEVEPSSFTASSGFASRVFNTLMAWARAPFWPSPSEYCDTQTASWGSEMSLEPCYPEIRIRQHIFLPPFISSK